MQANQRVGRLLLLDAAHVGKVRKWLCRCDCGTVKVVRELSLSQQRTKSCGCLRRELKNSVMGVAFPHKAALT